MSLLVEGSMDSITGPFPPHLPLKTPGIGAVGSDGKFKEVNISFIAEFVTAKFTGLKSIFDFNFVMSVMLMANLFRVIFGF